MLILTSYIIIIIFPAPLFLLTYRKKRDKFKLAIYVVFEKKKPEFKFIKEGLKK